MDKSDFLESSIYQLKSLKILNSELLPWAVVIRVGCASDLFENVFFDIILIDGGNGALFEPVVICFWLETICNEKTFQVPISKIGSSEYVVVTGDWGKREKTPEMRCDFDTY